MSSPSPYQPRDVVDLQQQPNHLAGAGGVERDVVVGAVEVHALVQLHVRLRSDGYVGFSCRHCAWKRSASSGGGRS